MNLITSIENEKITKTKKYPLESFSFSYPYLAITCQNTVVPDDKKSIAV